MILVKILCFFNDLKEDEEVHSRLLVTEASVKRLNKEVVAPWAVSQLIRISPLLTLSVD